MAEQYFGHLRRVVHKGHDMELKNGFADLSASMQRAGVLPHGGAQRSIYLHPGHLIVSAEPCVLTTILGSCIAVCLWDVSLRIGGMVHFLLPESSGGTGDASARYGDVAVPQLIREMKNRGANERLIKARIYGGACVLRAFRRDDGDHLGARNVRVAKDTLHAANIAIIEEQTMGVVSRKVLFDTASGNASIHVVNEANGH
jgi:chemotaxis protein CheD